MSNSKRDNFTEKTISILRRRVGNMCSNPNCFKHTVEGHSTNVEKVIDTGIAAHICAAAFNGPRYDESMTNEARKHISNAIWLCAHCSMKIDREPAAYPVELLKKWKVIAENRISLNSNQRLLTEQEAEYKVNQSFLQSLGLSIPEKFNTSLSGISKAVNQYFHNLDPRLNIKYSYINGVDNFQISSLQSETDEPILLKFNPECSQEYNIKIKNFINHGQPVTFNITELSSNSIGLNNIFPQTNMLGTVTINPQKDLKANIEILDSNDNILVEFENNLYIGETSFSFKSEKFDGLLSLIIDKANFKNEVSREETTILLNYKIWDSHDLQSLKYFTQIYRIFEKMYASGKITLNINIDGIVYFSSVISLENEKFYGLFYLLSYTYYSRLLCKTLDISILFDSSCSFSAEEYQDIYDTVITIKDINTKDPFTQTLKFNSLEYINPENLKDGLEISFNKEYIININNIFNHKVNERLFITHTFLNLKKEVLYSIKNSKHFYDIYFDNTDKSGTYIRSSSLKNPLHHTLK
ncbi:hypothetical protein [Acinetobacter bereziniae]|uniref:hypothetical protein n=1 Tax=Acinetobacter bereziniae TaxID=106648 RepID=UPI0030092D9F